MYKISKAKGYNEIVTIFNPETSSSYKIGRVTVLLLESLASEGITFGTEEKLKLTDEWNLSISDELGMNLLKETIKMEKKTKKSPKTKHLITDEPVTSTIDAETHKKNVNKQIDALDVLLGRATYIN